MADLTAAQLHEIGLRPDESLIDHVGGFALAYGVLISGQERDALVAMARRGLEIIEREQSYLRQKTAELRSKRGSI